MQSESKREDFSDARKEVIPVPLTHPEYLEALRDLKSVPGGEVERYKFRVEWNDMPHDEWFVLESDYEAERNLLRQRIEKAVETLNRRFGPEKEAYHVAVGEAVAILAGRIKE